MSRTPNPSESSLPIRIWRRESLRRKRRRQERERTSWVYCPNCRRDLNGDDRSFVDLVDEMGSFVRYTCATCGTNSEWDFDAPVPLYLGGWSS